MDVLLVIDMQEGLLLGGEKFELDAVLERIGELASRVRAGGGRVVFIQHDGVPGDSFAPDSTGWPLLGCLDRTAEDLVVRKTRNDAFHETELADRLAELGARRVLVSGWATDLCVDSTVRAAAARGFEVIVAADAHTVGDRPHLAAEDVIAHHHWVWRNLIAPTAVQVLPTAELWS